jgi:transporter family-2 protein
VLTVVLFSVRLSFPSLQTVVTVPWWAWTGGALGAAFVLSSTLLIPQLGAAKLVCLVVLGQIVGSLLLDHFGVLHAAKPIDALRLMGGALVVIGAMLVVLIHSPNTGHLVK